MGKNRLVRAARVAVGTAMIDGLTMRQCRDRILIADAATKFADLNDDRIRKANSKEQLVEVLCEHFDAHNYCAQSESIAISRRLSDFMLQNDLS